jgi:hypothetical protein
MNQLLRILLILPFLHKRAQFLHETEREFLSVCIASLFPKAAKNNATTE